MLDAPITEHEIQKAILSMQLGTTPGLDGYSVRFYKKFERLLSPYLLEIFH